MAANLCEDPERPFRPGRWGEKPPTHIDVLATTSRTTAAALATAAASGTATTARTAGWRCRGFGGRMSRRLTHSAATAATAVRFTHRRARLARASNGTGPVCTGFGGTNHRCLWAHTRRAGVPPVGPHPAAVSARLHRSNRLPIVSAPYLPVGPSSVLTNPAHGRIHSATLATVTGPGGGRLSGQLQPG